MINVYGRKNSEGKDLTMGRHERPKVKKYKPSDSDKELITMAYTMMVNPETKIFPVSVAVSLFAYMSVTRVSPHIYWEIFGMFWEYAKNFAPGFIFRELIETGDPAYIHFAMSNSEESALHEMHAGGGSIPVYCVVGMYSSQFLSWSDDINYIEEMIYRQSVLVEGASVDVVESMICPAGIKLLFKSSLGVEYVLDEIPAFQPSFSFDIPKIVKERTPKEEKSE